MTQHKHAELIKAWADNKTLAFEWRRAASVWNHVVGDPEWLEANEYRIKPVAPVAPKWPESNCPIDLLAIASNSSNLFCASLQAVANAALAHACQSGQLVTKDAHEDAVRKAYAQGQDIAYKHESESRNDRDMKIARAVARRCNTTLHDNALLFCITEATK